MAVSRAAHLRAGREGRILILCDNLAVVLAACRYRARDFKLFVILRRIASLALARDLRISFRWIPSEYNTADDDSRWHSAYHDNIKGLTLIFKSRTI